jgi:hypothetical protein
VPWRTCSKLMYSRLLLSTLVSVQIPANTFLWFLRHVNDSHRRTRRCTVISQRIPQHLISRSKTECVQIDVLQVGVVETRRRNKLPPPRPEGDWAEQGHGRQRRDPPTGQSTTQECVEQCGTFQQNCNNSARIGSDPLQNCCRNPRQALLHGSVQRGKNWQLIVLWKCAPLITAKTSQQCDWVSMWRA